MSTLTLPWPPAVNNLYQNVGKRRIRTKRYDAWLADAMASVLDQRPARVAGDFGLYITFERPDRRRRDLDGLLKAPLDLLVKAGLIEDDSRTATITASWSPSTPAKPGCCHVVITPVTA